MNIINRAKLAKSPEDLEKTIKECNELIAIFNKSIETAKKNI